MPAPDMRRRRPSLSSDTTRSVIVIDCDTSFCAWVESALTPLGFRVSLADAADDMAALVKRREPAVAIVEIALGERDGFAVARKIRDEQPWTPLILVSAAANIRRARDVYLGLPRPVFLEKPVDAENLALAIEASLSGMT